jgi:hypothetical protein
MKGEILYSLSLHFKKREMLYFSIALKEKRPIVNLESSLAFLFYIILKDKALSASAPNQTFYLSSSLLV